MPDPAEVATPPTQVPPTAPGVGNAPAAAGSMTPQNPAGEVEAAKLDMYHAAKLVERALGKFPAKSKEAEAALKIRSSFARDFGDFEDTSQEFSPAELKRMLASLSGPGAAGPGAPQQPQGA